MYPGLSLHQAPPISVPFRFFLTAPFFAMLAHAILMVGGPEVLTTRWHPTLLAAVHLYVLGFLAMTMFGALFQMLPVLVGAVIDNPKRSAGLVHTTLIIGVVFLASAFLYQQKMFWLLAGLALAGSVFWFLFKFISALLAAKANLETLRSLKAAGVSLGITAGLGFTMVTLTYFFDHPFRGWFTNVHAAFGVLGWVFLLITGVAIKVVPMFFVTDAYPEFQVKYLAPAVLAGLLVFAGGAWVPAPWDHILQVSAAMYLGILVFGFLAFTARLLLSRRRTQSDSSLGYWYLGLLSGGLALVLAVASGFGVWGHDHLDPTVQVAWLLIVGFASSVMIGMYFKIVPFLAWLHLMPLTKKVAGGPPPVRLPYMNHFLGETMARRQLLLFFAAWIAFLCHQMWPGPALFYLAELLSFFAHGLLAFQVWRAYLRHLTIWRAHRPPG